MRGFLDTYLKAVVAHTPSALPTTRSVKYTENGVRLNLGDGLWQTAAAMPTYRLEVLDTEAGQVGMIGRISENGNNNFFAVRLKIEMGKQVSEIEVLSNRSITAAGPSPFGPAADAPHPLMNAEIPKDKRLTRAELVSIGNSYFTGLDTYESGRNVPFSSECQRRENGVTTANNSAMAKGSMAWMDCKSQFDTGFSTIVTNIRERRFAVVDPETGLAFGWGYFDHSGVGTLLSPVKVDPKAGGAFNQPVTFYIAEIFKIVDGNIRQIEAVLTTVPYSMPSGW